jgi:oligoribonuclease NrnB/cAMP/cGMP phosphodiesterase (DHH superfamily)
MKEELYSWESRSMEEKRMMPREWWYEDRDAKRQAAKNAARDVVRGEDVVILGDADADGLGAVAAIREFYDEDVAFVSCGPHGADMYLGDALWVCVDELKEGATVIVQDVAVDEDWKVKALPKVAETAGEILWFDHHEWPEQVAEFVEEHVDLLELDTGEDDKTNDVFEARCAAMMLRDHYVAQGHEFSDKFDEAMDVTGEYDLWRLRDDRCFDLNDLTHTVDDHDEYVALLREHGADVMDDDEVAAAVAEYRKEQTALHDMAVENVERYQIGEWVVAAVYGNCPTNDVAETLRERGLADAVVFSTPHGGLSLRGSENFQQCHIIAQTFSGGGHAKAAGAGMYDEFDSHLDYAKHWTSEGEHIIARVIDEFRSLADDQSDADAEADASDVTAD